MNPATLSRNAVRWGLDHTTSGLLSRWGKCDAIALSRTEADCKSIDSVNGRPTN
jgi:hypothetical protein